MPRQQKEAILLRGSNRILKYPNDEICPGTLDQLLGSAHRREIPDSHPVLVKVRERCGCKKCDFREPNYVHPYEKRTVGKLKALYENLTGKPFNHKDRPYKKEFLDPESAIPTMETVLESVRPYMKQSIGPLIFLPPLRRKQSQKYAQ